MLRCWHVRHHIYLGGRTPYDVYAETDPCSPPPPELTMSGAQAVQGEAPTSAAVEQADGSHRFVGQVTFYARALGVALAQKTYDTDGSQLWLSLDTPGIAGAGLRHQGDAGSERNADATNHILITLLGSPGPSVWP